MAALNQRINVLQSKLNQREDELHVLHPAVAELEQAKKTARIEGNFHSTAAGFGAIFLAAASFYTDEKDVGWRFGMLGAGIAALAIAICGKLVFANFGWPKSRMRP